MGGCHLGLNANLNLDMLTIIAKSGDISTPVYNPRNDKPEVYNNHIFTSELTVSSQPIFRRLPSHIQLA